MWMFYFDIQKELWYKKIVKKYLFLITNYNKAEIKLVLINILRHQELLFIVVFSKVFRLLKYIYK